MEEIDIWTESQNLIKEKKNQEFIYLNKVNPVNRKILQRLITEFDLSNSWVKILKKYDSFGNINTESASKEDRVLPGFEESKSLLDELKKSFLIREVFLNQHVSIINEAETKFLKELNY